jgi:hypothetical protein
MIFLHHPKAMVPVERPPPSMKLRRTLIWSNSLPSLSNSSSKGRFTSSRKSLRIPKAVKFHLPLHEMKRPMLHLKKKSRTRKEKREIRDPTTLLPLIMIIYLTLAPSLRYPLVNPLILMGWTILNGVTRWGCI